MTYISFLETPIGNLRILSKGRGISEIKFVDFEVPEDPDVYTESAKTQLAEYFKGNRDVFNVELAANGTDFEQQVWTSLTNVKYGTTSTYGTIAEMMGDKHLAQAVGSANGKNPILIIVPCHRIVGLDNKLTGYSGGVDRKEWLLKHEGALMI